MDGLLHFISEKPLASVLVLAGLAFLALAFMDKTPYGSAHPQARGWSAAAGTLLVLSGLALYTVGPDRPNGSLVPTVQPVISANAQANQTPTLPPTAPPTMSPTMPPTSVFQATVLPPVNRCAYQPDTDSATLMQLIRAEGEAANTENIDLIRTIFAENAIINDMSNNQQWTDPIVRYTALFHDIDFKGVEHFDSHPVGPGIGPDIAYFTSGSRGQYTNGDGWASFDNAPGSDHWTFRKNRDGCWVIAEFSFNAHHIPFP